MRLYEIQNTIPVEFLYHATNTENVASIMRNGLLVNYRRPKEATASAPKSAPNFSQFNDT